MPAWTIFLATCALGVPFYLWFLVAICKEFRGARVGCLVRIQPTSHEFASEESTRDQMPRARAA